MIREENILMVGGNGRNIGKTYLAEMAIEKLSRNMEVVGLKISNISPETIGFHGVHVAPVEQDFFIYEESDHQGTKDSMRFLKAGAKQSFFIQSDDEHLQEAFRQFMQMVKHGVALVCESNSLRQWVEPGVLLMVRGDEQAGNKNVETLLSMADAIVPARNHIDFERAIKSIKFSEGKFSFLKDN